MSWIPMSLYPVFEFRRQDFREHPWWGDVLGAHPELVKAILKRIETEGPLRSSDIESDTPGTKGSWNYAPHRRALSALWSSGRLAVRERRNFQRIFDLTERVIPERWRRQSVPREGAVKELLLKALQGHGWARTGTLAATWRLREKEHRLKRALAELVEEGRVIDCDLELPNEKRLSGLIRAEDLELAVRLRRARPREDRGVLLSPFDPVLWDRTRLKLLFDFEHSLEIFKPKSQRRYGYYCLPVLAGDRFVARYDLKADSAKGQLRVLTMHLEPPPPLPVKRKAAADALKRFAQALELRVVT